MCGLGVCFFKQTFKLQRLLCGSDISIEYQLAKVVKEINLFPRRTGDKKAIEKDT